MTIADDEQPKDAAPAASAAPPDALTVERKKRRRLIVSHVNKDVLKDLQFYDVEIEDMNRNELIGFICFLLKNPLARGPQVES